MNRRIGASPWIFLVMLAIRATGVLAQTPEPLDQPNLSMSGHVNAVAKQPDGGIVFGGLFSSINGVARNNLARLLPDGTLDPDWDPSPNGGVTSLVTDDAGQVYAAGYFSHIGGLTRDRLARISPGGQGFADGDWNPAVPGDSYYLYIYALSKAGYLYIADPMKLLRVATDANGALDTTWNPPSGGYVYSVLPFADGNVYVGGMSLQNGGQGLLGRISETGSGAFDTDWKGDALFSEGDSVGDIATDGNALFIAGFFHLQGQEQTTLAKILLQGTGVLDPAWTVRMDPPFLAADALAYDGHGSVYAGGVFSSVCDDYGCAARAGLVKLSTTSPARVAGDWNPAATQRGYYWMRLALSADGAGLIVVGGNTALMGGNMTLGSQTRVGLAVIPIDNEHLFANGFE